MTQNHLLRVDETRCRNFLDTTADPCNYDLRSFFSTSTGRNLQGLHLIVDDCGKL